MAQNIITDLNGIINELNISEEDVLFPIFEGVVNSIQSIEEAGVKEGCVKVTVCRDHTQTELFEEFESYPISEIQIEDNGSGFNSSNYESYRTAHSTKKYKLGGKGVGRFAMLAVFDKITIDSIIASNEKNHIKFELSRKDGLSTPVYGRLETTPRTFIRLQGVNNKFSKAVAKYNDEEIINKLLGHCLLYYLNKKAPQILYTDSDGITTDLNRKFNPNYFVKKEDEDIICDKKFKIYHVKSQNASCHEICLCGHNRLVKSKRLDAVLPVFSSAIEEFGESYYLKTYVISDYLDNIVKIGRNEFNFPKEKKHNDDDEQDSIELNFDEPVASLCESSIYQMVIRSIRSIFPEELEKREKKVKKNVDEFLDKDLGIEFRHVTFTESFYAGIKDGATDLQIYKALQRYRYHQSLELRKKEEKLLKREYSNSDNYKDLLKSYVDMRTQESMSALAKYVYHRRVIIELLERYLTWCDEEQNYEEESSLHNLIFTMGENQATKRYDEHNLWILDDRLAFHRYIYSDKQIRLHEPNVGKTDCAKETDLAIYDIPFGYDEENEYGNINSIVIFELKRPNRDVTVADYTKQMKEQVKGIREGRKKKYNGANLQIQDSTPIYFYYVIDENSYGKVKQELMQYDYFKETPYHSLVRMTGTLYEEILTYQTLLINAKRRNKIFFDKLGIKTK